MTDSELAEAIASLEARIVSGIKSTETDGVRVVYESVKEARAELARLKRIQCKRNGGTGRKRGPFTPMFGGG